MVVEAALAAMLAATAALAARVLLRADTGPAGWWLAGWVGAGAAGLLALLEPDLAWLHLASHPLGALFPWLLLGGVWLLGERRPVPWLLAAGLLLGFARMGLAAAGHPSLAYGVALMVDPWVTLVAGLLAVDEMRVRGGTRAERWLGPSIVALGMLGAVHLAALASSPTVPHGLLALWLIALPVLLGVQMYGAAEHGRRALRRARDELEERVAQRTEDLARANQTLRERIDRDAATREALRRSEERYRSISELSSDLSFGFRIDDAGAVEGEWVTDALTRITGYRRAEISGDQWLRMIHPEDLEAARSQFFRALAGGDREIELRILRRDGEVRWIRTLVDVRPDERRGGHRVVGASRDVTDRKLAELDRARLEARTHEAARLESLVLLSGGIAHDFNNLLTVILGNARLLRADLAGDAAGRTRLARIEAAAEHAARLTQQMLAYAGRASLSIKPVDLSRVVEELADLLAASLPAEARLETSLEPRLVIEGDATQLAQVVMNLVTNAAEALEGRPGTVRIRTERLEVDAGDLVDVQGASDPTPGSYVALAVSDTGRGMDEATRRRVFEPFFTTKFSGRGLGLAAVLGLVTAHGGVVALASEPGQGTTVRVLLPPAGEGPVEKEEGREPGATAR